MTKINNRVRGAIAAAAIATSIAVSLAGAGAARAHDSEPADPTSVDVPPVQGAAERPPGPWIGARPYVVLEGDSFWTIAERFVPDGATNDDVARRAEQLMTANASKLGYDDPAMIQPGDAVTIPPLPVADPVAEPVALREVSPKPASHAVVTGDSYWAIAQSFLGADAIPSAVLAKTEELIELNGARLGYEDPNMLHPGDVVYLAAPAPTPVPQPVEDAPEVPTAPKAAKPLPQKAPKALTVERTTGRAETPDSPPRSELAIIATSRQAPSASHSHSQGKAIAV
jgi:nucleoid-associated protein YgaU